VCSIDYEASNRLSQSLDRLTQLVEASAQNLDRLTVMVQTSFTGLIERLDTLNTRLTSVLDSIPSSRRNSRKSSAEQVGGSILSLGTPSTASLTASEDNL